MRSLHFFLVVVCFLSVPSVLSQFIASIDCGYSGEVYLDSNLITWESDDDYIQHGYSKAVPSSNSFSTEMDTLRVFTTRKKNCYDINNVAQGDQILIRASFYYGNYDGKSSPPVFDLQFSGNKWLTVQTSSDAVISHEVIYVVGEYTPSVCVALTKSGNFPFISAIEVCGLASTMYGDVGSDRALFLKDRISYGSDEIIRYSDDSYDRLWFPGGGGTGTINVTSDAIFIENAAGDYPPVKALTNAITPSINSGNILLSSSPFSTSDNHNFLAYLNLYFSEVRELDETTELRSFNVYIDDQLWNEDSPVKPPYGSFTEYFGNASISSNSSIKLVQTSDSTLPPLINSLEWFFVSDVLSNGINTNDAEGLSALQEAFEVLQDWQGDSCLPVSFSWDWITCSKDPIPRVTAMDLSSFNLSGTLPDFSSMDALETIDLHNNTVQGPIPDFLGQLPNLKQLDLSKNGLSGSIPSSLSSNKNIKLDVSGNPGLCSPGESCQNPSGSPGFDEPSLGSKKKKKSKLPLILGTSIPASLLVWIVAGIYAVLRIKRKNVSVTATIEGQENGGDEHKQDTENHKHIGVKSVYG